MKESAEMLESIYEDGCLEVLSVKPGHAYHIYDVGNLSGSLEASNPLGKLCFQDGPIKEAGVNGIQNEPVIAILIDRLKYLDGLFPSEYNKAAIHHLQSALDSLEARTKDRQNRGVEGTNQE